MNYDERRKLRVDLLKGLYEHYFQNEGKYKEVFVDKTDKETKLAYRYLTEIGLMNSEQFEHLEGKSFRFTITARGIDFVEEGKGKRRGDFQGS